MYVLRERIEDEGEDEGEDGGDNGEVDLEGNREEDASTLMFMCMYLQLERMKVRE